MVICWIDAAIPFAECTSDRPKKRAALAHSARHSKYAEILALGALMVGMCGLLLGNGLFGTLTALRMTEEGFDPTIIGAVLSCHSIGFIVGCLYGQRIIQRTGHIRCFAAFAAMLAVVCLVLPMMIEWFTWIPLRLVFGISSAMVFMVAESWLTGTSLRDNRFRGATTNLTVKRRCCWLGPKDR